MCYCLGAARLVGGYRGTGSYVMHRTVGSFPGGRTEIFDFQCRSLYNVVHKIIFVGVKREMAMGEGGENCIMMMFIHYRILTLKSLN